MPSHSSEGSDSATVNNNSRKHSSTRPTLTQSPKKTQSHTQAETQRDSDPPTYHNQLTSSPLSSPSRPSHATSRRSPSAIAGPGPTTMAHANVSSQSSSSSSHAFDAAAEKESSIESSSYGSRSVLSDGRSEGSHGGFRRHQRVRMPRTDQRRQVFVGRKESDKVGRESGPGSVNGSGNDGDGGSTEENKPTASDETVLAEPTVVKNGRILPPKGAIEWQCFVEEYLSMDIRLHSQFFRLEAGALGSVQQGNKKIGEEKTEEPVDEGESDLVAVSEAYPETDAEYDGRHPQENGQPIDEQDQDADVNMELRSPMANSRPTMGENTQSTTSLNYCMPLVEAPDRSEGDEMEQGLRDYHPADYRSDYPQRTDIPKYAQSDTTDPVSTLASDFASLSTSTSPRLRPSPPPATLQSSSLEPTSTEASEDMATNQDPDIPNILKSAEEESSNNYATYRRGRQERHDAKSSPKQIQNLASDGRKTLARGLGQSRAWRLPNETDESKSQSSPAPTEERTRFETSPLDHQVENGENKAEAVPDQNEVTPICQDQHRGKETHQTSADDQPAPFDRQGGHTPKLSSPPNSDLDPDLAPASAETSRFPDTLSAPVNDPSQVTPFADEVDGKDVQEMSVDGTLHSSASPPSTERARPKSDAAADEQTTSVPTTGNTPLPPDQESTFGGSLGKNTAGSYTPNVSSSGVGINTKDAEAERCRKFYEEFGYMCAPQQPYESTRRRLRALRRLGLDRPGQPIHRPTLDRFTRLACSIFRTQMSSVTIVGEDNQLFPSEVGLHTREMSLDLGFCTHAALSESPCLIVEDAAQDWRFMNHPMVDRGNGPIRFYAGYPLIFGRGRKAASIGTLCVIDSQPRYDFDKHSQMVLSDLAACVVNELELLYQEMNQQTQQKMHQVTVNFLRRSLQVILPRPAARRKPPSSSEPETKATNAESNQNGTLPDSRPSNEFSLHVDACDVIRETLGANAVAIVDLSQFHVFWPSTQLDSEGLHSQQGDGSSVAGTGVTVRSSNSSHSTNSGLSCISTGSSGESDDPANPYRKSRHRSQARPLVNTTSKVLPNVQFVPRRRRSEPVNSISDEAKGPNVIDSIPVLGVSSADETAAFNFDSPEAKRIISEFIQLNLGQRRVWYERDESQGIAESIKVLMPKGTQVSLALPVFDFQGQGSFCVTVCWNDELYSYDNAVIAFVENICGTLQAGSLRNRLTVLEQSQRAFAALTNHEIRTPMHQILSTANLIRSAVLEGTPPGSPSCSGAPGWSLERRNEFAMLCNTLETSGHALEGILNDVLDYLDVSADHHDDSKHDGEELGFNKGDGDDSGLKMDTLLAQGMLQAYKAEDKVRSIAESSMSDVEVILEVIPRSAGSWVLLRDSTALMRAIYKLSLNAFQATQKGYVKLVCEDVSRNAQVPIGYNTSMPTSIIAIRISDTGKGMSPQFAETDIFKPFTKDDAFSPGSGLGVTLSQRMIDLMGGRMSFTSKPGEGTTVVVEVPLCFQDEDGSSIESGPEDDEALSDHDEEVISHPICLLGFPSRSENLGLNEVCNSLYRQLSLLKCRLTEDVQEAGLLIVEECYDLLKHHPELKSRAPSDLRIIMLGSAQSAVDSPKGSRNFLEGTDLPVEWLYRPLFPELIEKIAREISGEILPSPQPSPRITPVSRSPIAEFVTPTGHHSAGASPKADRADFPSTEPMDLHLNQASRRGSVDYPIESDMDSIKDADHTFKVLVIEDNLVNRKLLAGTLRKMGINCAEAVDGVEGISEYTRFRPALVLLDINMPRKDGFETAADIRAYETKRNLPRSKIIAITALSGEAHRRRGLFESDIDEWFTKPVTIRNLRSDIEDLRKKLDSR